MRVVCDIWSNDRNEVMILIVFIYCIDYSYVYNSVS